MPPARRPQLDHIKVRLRVSVDRAAWRASFGSPEGDIDEQVRGYVVDVIRSSDASRRRAIVSVRRDGS